MIKERRAMRIFQVAIMFITLMLSVGSSWAGLFAHGGGESRHIASVTPALIYNSSRSSVSIRGQFSRERGNGRVVIAGPRLLGPVPVSINRWSDRLVGATLPAHLAPGRYQLFLQRFFRDNGRGQWRNISDGGAIVVAAGSAPVNRDGSPHAAPIAKRNQDALCNGPDIRIRITGGPFKRDGRAYPIRAEYRSTNYPVGSRHIFPPRFVPISNSEAEVRVGPCYAVYRGAQIRLVYPDRSRSNWISIKSLQVP